MRGPNYISREEWNQQQRLGRRRKSVWVVGACIVFALASISLITYPRLTARKQNSTRLNKLQVFVDSLDKVQDLTLAVDRLEPNGKVFHAYREHYKGSTRLTEWEDGKIGVQVSPDFSYYRDRDRVVSFPPSTISSVPMKSRILASIKRGIESEAPVTVGTEWCEIMFEDRVLRFKYSSEKITEVEFHGETDAGLVCRVKVKIDYKVDSNYLESFQATEDADPHPVHQISDQPIEVFDVTTNQMGDIFMFLKGDPRSMIEVETDSGAHYQAALSSDRRGQTIRGTLFSGLTKPPTFPFTVTIKIAPSRFAGEVFTKKVTFQQPDHHLMPLNWMGQVLDENLVWRHFQARNILKATADSRKYYAADGTLYYPMNRETNTQLMRRGEDQNEAVVGYQRALNYMEEGLTEVIRPPEDLYWEIHLIETELGNKTHALEALKRAKVWADIKGNSSPFTVFIVAAFKKEF